MRIPSLVALAVAVFCAGLLAVGEKRSASKSAGGDPEARRGEPIATREIL